MVKDMLIGFLESMKTCVQVAPNAVWIDGWNKEDEETYQEIVDLIEQHFEYPDIEKN